MIPLFFLLACSKGPAPAPEAPPVPEPARIEASAEPAPEDPEPDVDEATATTEDQAETTSQAEPAPSAEAGDLPGGAPCLSADDCATGVCEGLGCTDEEPGLCAPAERACTRDLKAFCGCDGETFRASSSCPGRRFADRGACPGEGPLNERIDLDLDD